jgi:hypothetical protein
MERSGSLHHRIPARDEDQQHLVLLWRPWRGDQAPWHQEAGLMPLRTYFFAAVAGSKLIICTYSQRALKHPTVNAGDHLLRPYVSIMPRPSRHLMYRPSAAILN